MSVLVGGLLVGLLLVGYVVFSIYSPQYIPHLFVSVLVFALILYFLTGRKEKKG